MQKLALCSFIFILGGCSIIPTPGNPPKLYTLESFNPSVDKGRKSAITIMVDNPTVHTPLNNTRVGLKSSALSVDYFADVAWADRLADLIKESIIYSLQNSGRVESAFGTTSGVRADYLLRIEVRDFNINYFTNPKQPQADVNYFVQIVDNLNRNVLETKDIRCFHPVKGDSSDEIIAALNSCHLKVIQKLIDWVVSFERVKDIE